MSEAQHQTNQDSAAVALEALRDMRILIVDDNAFNRDLLASILEREGFTNLETAKDGQSALAKIASAPPDLLLLDLIMPNTDGYEVCRQLRKNDQYVNLPILVQSILNSPQDLAKAFAAGTTDFLTKPINAPELLARTRVHLQRRALVRALVSYRKRTTVELERARSMQVRLLPTRTEMESFKSAGLSLAAHFEPSSELGGDFWGMARTHRGDPIIYLVDFSGHGVNAALNTFRLHAIFQQLEFGAIEPGEILVQLNTRIAPLLPTGQYATVLIGIFDCDRQIFSYATAASTAPIVWNDSEAPAVLPSSGLPLGITTRANYESREIPFPPGTSIMFYSDAATEAEINGEMLAEDGLINLLIQLLAEGKDGDAMVAKIAETLHIDRLGALEDDLTMVVLRHELSPVP